MGVEGFDLDRVVVTLADKEKVFCSETDFQLALGWRIHEMYPHCRVFLEYPLEADETTNKEHHLDILLEQDRTKIAVELKYKTHGVIIGNTELRSQRAQDVSRYLFLKDIQRLEEHLAKREISRGYVLLLTNDPLYWKKPINTSTIDRCFLIYKGKSLHGVLTWDQPKSGGTRKLYKDEVLIRGSYTMMWKSYTTATDEKYGQFKYLGVKIQDYGLGLPRGRCPKAR